MNLSDCKYCGLPLEIKTEWEQVNRAMNNKGQIIQEIITSMATATCLNGHWYGGPLEDIQNVG